MFVQRVPLNYYLLFNLFDYFILIELVLTSRYVTHFHAKKIGCKFSKTNGSNLKRSLCRIIIEPDFDNWIGTKCGKEQWKYRVNVWRKDNTQDSEHMYNDMYNRNTTIAIRSMKCSRSYLVCFVLFIKRLECLQKY